MWRDWCRRDGDARMIGTLLTVGMRTCGRWQLVLFDLALTVIGVLPLALVLADTLRSATRGLEIWLASPDPRTRALAVGEALASADYGFLLPALLASAVVLSLARIFAGAALATTAATPYPGFPAVVHRGAQHFGFNLLISLVETFALAVLGTLGVLLIGGSYAALIAGAPALIAGMAVGLFGGIGCVIVAAVRGAADLARGCRRWDPTCTPGGALRRGIGWFFRIPFTAGAVAATWLVIPVVLELVLLVLESATGAATLAGMLLLVMLVPIGLLLRSGATVARYGSMGQLNDLLRELDQERELEQWMRSIPEALWVLPPHGEDEIEEDDADWPAWTSSSDRDH